DLGVAVVLGGEGELLAVGREAGEHLVAVVPGEPPGDAAGGRDGVEVAGVAEGDLVAVDGREPQQPGLVRGRCGPGLGRGEGQGEEEEGGQGRRRAPGGGPWGVVSGWVGGGPPPRGRAFFHYAAEGGMVRVAGADRREAPAATHHSPSDGFQGRVSAAGGGATAAVVVDGPVRRLFGLVGVPEV